MLTKQRQAELQNGITSSSTQHNIDSITLGIVVDTNDPQQMGRARVVCQRWGDSFDSDVEHIPWASYISPYGGQANVGNRGPSLDSVDGGVAYGFWAPPKIGDQVAVMCLDGSPNARVYIGSMFAQFVPHTMPHGRFMYDDHPNLDNTTAPAGPYSSTERPIEPLWTNMHQAFGGKATPNYEWGSRGADYSVAAVDVQNLSSTNSTVPDDKDITKDNWTSTQGYQTSRMDPASPSVHTKEHLDNMVVSLTSPGFHALSMDDRIENCRIRIRSTAGHQILMDDTNERMYISTAKGETWIELDQSGNIDIYATKRINMHGKSGVNITSDEDIRMSAKKGIHLVAHDTINMQTTNDIHVLSGSNIRLQSTNSTLITAGDTVEVASGSNLNLTSAMNVNIGATGNIVQTAAAIHQNGPAATAAQSAAAQPAKWTDRVPQHEPWPRVMTKDDYSHTPQFQYDDSNVNRQERDQLIARGMYWRR